MTAAIIFFLHIITIFIIYYYAYHHIVLFHLVYMLTGEILLQKHTERKILLVNMVHFHLSLSGCSTGSLETCTHIISMPESHIITPIQFYPDLIPTCIPRIIVRAYEQFISLHIIMKYAVKHFHLSLSRCSMGSLETCTHVISMPESHTVTPIKI